MHFVDHFVNYKYLQQFQFNISLFTLEDNYGRKTSKADGEVCLKVDVRKNKDAARLHEMLCS